MTIRGYQRLIKKPPSAALFHELAHLYNVEASNEPELGERQRLHDIARQLHVRGAAAAAILILFR